MFKPLYTLFYRKYWFDELYENIIVRLALLKGLFAGLQVFDNNAVDGAVNGVAGATIAGGRAIRRTQTGQLQLYGLVIGVGILAIILCLFLFG
jgi:NADH-quinone oxidoreductase subunit L